MLQDAATYSVIGTYPWILSPVGFVLVTVFAFNALGDGLRGAVDPIEVAEMTVALAKSLAPTVRYDEMLTRLGYFVTESSEHFAEYTPYFIKDGRPDLIEKYGIPLDEYPKRCIEQIERWKGQAEAYRSADRIEVEQSREYASSIMNSVWTGEPSVIYGNVRNNGCITSLPRDCAAEVPCLVDASGIQPTYIGELPPQLTALIRTNINVQELTVRALMTENREHIYHAAMMDPHTAAELDLDQIWSLVDDLLAAHGDWLPAWARVRRKTEAA